MMFATQIRAAMRAAMITLPCLALVGCAEQNEEPRQLRQAVDWGALSNQRIAEPMNEFKLLAPGGTDGQFPTSIAIARLGVQPADNGTHAVALEMEPANDFLSWNLLFDHVRYVSDSFPMHSADLNEMEATPERIAAAAGELRAGLCLIYGRGDLSYQESIVRGVLYDTRTGKPLMVVSTTAVAPEPQYAEHPPEHVEEDMSHADPRVLASSEFERLVLEGLVTMYESDRPATVAPPDGWKPEGPIRPRVWPPGSEIWPEP